MRERVVWFELEGDTTALDACEVSVDLRDEDGVEHTEVWSVADLLNAYKEVIG